MAIVVIAGPILAHHAEAIAAASRAAPHDLLQVVINSEGGSLAAAFAVCDAIDSHKGKSAARVVDRADSAARLVVGSCRNIRSGRASSSYLFHSVAYTSLPGRMTGGTLRGHAAVIDDLDQRCRQRLAGYIGCSIAEIARLEAANRVLTGREALAIGLINDLVGAPVTSQRAADARIEGILAATRPLKFDRVDLALLQARGLVNRPLGVGRNELRAILDRQR